jgi:hypothetical protein
VVGDCHGHLQLALCVLARWQRELGRRFEAAFLCGDVGTFTEEAQLDSATRRHARTNPCELEFLTQWANASAAPWLDLSFGPEAEGGLGLDCPVVMVHGNHEGFTHLERLVPPHFPSEPIPLSELPGVDARQRLRLLPSSWRAVTPSGHLVDGVGGIEQGQRQARYHPMAYLDDDAVAHLLQQGQVHLLLTHQGPSAVQGDHGSPTLQLLLDEGIASAWCHGHSTPNPQPVQAGPAGKTQVVPLGDIAFPVRGPHKDEAGPDGWALATLGRSKVFVEKKTPPFLREFRRTRWACTEEGLLIAPPLVWHAWSFLR